MKNLFLGFGNEYCGNDAIGIIVTQKLKKELTDWDIKTGAFSGIDFLEAIEGYDQVVVIDGYYKENTEIGKVYELQIEQFAGLKGFSYLHSLDLSSALEIGKRLQLTLPKKMKIFGIGIDKKGEIGEPLNSILAQRLSEIVEAILSIITNSNR